MRGFAVWVALAVLGVTAASAAAQAPDSPPPGGYSGPLFPMGEASLATGEINKGEAIVSVPVRYSFTGTLEEPIRNLAPFNKVPELEAGHPMFAVIMGDRRNDASVIWCTNRTRRTKSELAHRETICFPQLPAGVHRWRTVTSLLPIWLSVSNSIPGASAPKVKIGPADFGAMTLSYRLVEFDAKDVDIAVHLSVKGRDTEVRQLSLPREADGSVLMPLMGGTIRLSQNAKDRKSATAEVVTPLSASSPDVLIPSR